MITRGTSPNPLGLQYLQQPGNPTTTNTGPPHLIFNYYWSCNRKKEKRKRNFLHSSSISIPTPAPGLIFTSSDVHTVDSDPLPS